VESELMAHHEAHRIVDSHAHIVSDDIRRYPVAPLSGQVRPGDLDEPLTVERLLAAMDEQGVEQAFLVQRAHIYGYDNSYVVDSAQRFPRRLKAVCIVDARDADAPRMIRHWVRERGAVAVRLTEPYKDAGTGWFAGEEAMKAWHAAADLGVSLRLHFYRWNRNAGLSALMPLLHRFRDLPIVLDHLSNLAVEKGPPDFGFDERLRALIDFPNVHLMFSTINFARLAGAGIAAAPMIERVLRELDARRLMWGSDIAQSKGTYAELVQLARAAVEPLADDVRSQLLYGTAAALHARAA
jgi:L-fuconolactonase